MVPLLQRKKETIQRDPCDYKGHTHTPTQHPTKIHPHPTPTLHAVVPATPVNLSPCDPTRNSQVATQLQQLLQPQTKPTPIIQAFAVSSMLGGNHPTLPPSLHKTSSKFGWTITLINSAHPTNHNAHTLPACFLTAVSPTPMYATTNNSRTSSNRFDLFHYNHIAVPSLASK